MRSSIVLFCLLIVNIVNAGYKEYSEEIQISEKYLIENKLDLALTNYLSVLKKYDYPYVKEILQATYISCYVGDKSTFELLLVEATKKGMSNGEYDFLKKTWNEQNTSSFDENVYYQNRKTYLEQLNTEKMSEYVKLDFYVNIIQKKLRGTKEEQYEYFQQMNLLRNRYLELIEIYGYPTDQETGRKFERKLAGKLGTNNTKFLFVGFKNGYMDSIFGGKAVQFSTTAKNAVWSSLDVGAWFLTHYVPKNVNMLDSTLFYFVEKGVNQLKMSPYLLINMLESTRLPQNDFALTYYSRMWLDLQMNYHAKYNMPTDKRDFVNLNRTKYGIRTLEQEEQLLRSLFKLKTKQDLPNNFSNKDIQAISFENRLFLNYMA